jgi:hypothetical protein
MRKRPIPRGEYYGHEISDQQLLSALAKPVAQHVAETVSAAVAPLIARLQKLEARPHGMSYEGVWRAGVQYEANSLVTASNALWHTARGAPADQKPGNGETQWKLIAKRVT